MTASYSVSVTRSAEKELRKAPPDVIPVLVAKMSSLSGNPRPHGCRKLADSECYRLRQGDWRVIYEVDDQAKLVRVVKVGNRKEVYR